jgi:UDP-GlcNAc:undecaprenyl-phosphate GlcNAc-1-phosphate transferase
VSLRHYLFIIVVGALITVALTPIVRILSERFGLVDEPGGRKVHTKAISRLGGIAIFIGFSAALAAQVVGERLLGWREVLTVDGMQLPGVLAGMLVIFLVGVVDDIITLNPGSKFIGQLAAAGIVIAAGVRIDYVGNPAGGGLVALGLMGIPVTLIYIVGFTNVINLIDGLDGLAAGVSAIAATSFLVMAVATNQLAAAALAAALIGACLGFLRYNFNPASIFMGDSGAMFLGFALATISLLGVMKSVAAITLAVPLLTIGVPIFDTASAIVRRLLHRQPIQAADKGHIHHRLLGRGFDQRQTVLIIYFWSAALAVGGYAMRYAPTLLKLLSFALLAALSGLMAYWLGLFEAAHQHAEEHDAHRADLP